ncbi:hypothetical protein [Borrelia persica]|uniref:hypothetical protein n=1 Tax=Borrelia persica TaxID=44448 RepID=UPI0004647E4B|nr:hypothetical protein [Borrelia persica]
MSQDPILETIEEKQLRDPILSSSAFCKNPNPEEESDEVLKKYYKLEEKIDEVLNRYYKGEKKIEEIEKEFDEEDLERRRLAAAGEVRFNLKLERLSEEKAKFEARMTKNASERARLAKERARLTGERSDDRSDRLFEERIAKFVEAGKKVFEAEVARLKEEMSDLIEAEVDRFTEAEKIRRVIKRVKCAEVESVKFIEVDRLKLEAERETCSRGS